MKRRLFAICLVAATLYGAAHSAMGQLPPPARHTIALGPVSVGKGIFEYASHFEQFSQWKVRLEGVVLDIKRAYPPESRGRRGAKWLYDDARASVNALIDRMILDLAQRATPASDEPYRESIIAADAKVKMFLSHARDLTADNQRDFSSAAWQRSIVVVLSFLDSAIDLMQEIVRALGPSRKSESNKAVLQLYIHKLQDLRLREFDAI